MGIEGVTKEVGEMEQVALVTREGGERDLEGITGEGGGSGGGSRGGRGGGGGPRGGRGVEGITGEEGGVEGVPGEEGGGGANKGEGRVPEACSSRSRGP